MKSTDERLVSRVKNGDGEAFGRLFTKYQDKIYNFIYAMVGNAEDTKDLTQRAFIKVFEAMGRLDEKELNFSAYLYKTARNTTFDEMKRKSRLASPAPLEKLEDADIYTQPQRAFLLREQQAQVRRAAAKLTDDYLTVFNLREAQDLSYDEIAAIMEIPKNSVGVLLSRARLKFKREFRMSNVNVDKLSKECQKMLPMLSAFIDNELTDRQKVKVKAHLDDCPLCRLALEELTDAAKSYRGLIPLLPPPTLKAEAMERIAKLTRLSQSSGFTPAQPASLMDRFRNLSVIKKLLISLVSSVIILSAGFTTGYYGLAAVRAVNDYYRPPAKPALKPHRAKKEKVTPFTETVTTDTQPVVEEGEATPAVSGNTVKPAPIPAPPPQTPPPTTTTPTMPPPPDTTSPPAPRLISPTDGQLVKDANVTFMWSPSSDPGGVTYSIEIQTMDNQSLWQPLELKEGLAAASYAHTIGYYTERWRVWAVDGAGNKSPKTGWWQVGPY